MFFSCFSHYNEASGEDVLLLLPPAAWPWGFSANTLVARIEVPDSPLCPPPEEGLSPWFCSTFGRKLLSFSQCSCFHGLLPHPWEENQVSSPQHTRSVPATRWLRYAWHSCLHQVNHEQEGCLPQMNTCNSWDISLRVEEQFQIPLHWTSPKLNPRFPLLGTKVSNGRLQKSVRAGKARTLYLYISKILSQTPGTA